MSRYQSFPGAWGREAGLGLGSLAQVSVCLLWTPEADSPLGP